MRTHSLLSLRAIADGAAIQSIMHARMRATLFTWILGSASTHATRRAGPGPQDDMFLSSFYFVVVFRKKKSVSSRGPAPAKTSVFAGGCRPRDPGNKTCRAATQYLNFAL